MKAGYGKPTTEPRLVETRGTALKKTEMKVIQKDGFASIAHLIEAVFPY